ncbi:hypothetical protein [Roseofilum capinflatum]|uniref:Uncharacterized protein n=1 Tax=Roseofilum capinflatum BLCC-M114 TaxID=3022440 RepID=A0ABT7B464_9CYAN|nr:hypothetical protein [Roseofilum capinflatum]MDJ1173969.1 hypothetical protein [Roseofilum capinflatum BLCC-M114]
MKKRGFLLRQYLRYPFLPNLSIFSNNGAIAVNFGPIDKIDKPLRYTGLEIQQFSLLWCTVLTAQSHVPQPYSLFPSAKRYIRLGHPFKSLFNYSPF